MKCIGTLTAKNGFVGNLTGNADSATKDPSGNVIIETYATKTEVAGKASADHTHGNVSNDGKLGSASVVVVTNTSKEITASTVTTTELGYLSGVTSSIQTQLSNKATSDHTHGNLTNDGKVGNTEGLPLITGTGGLVSVGSFGTTAGTFCQGNDSRLSDARTPISHTHGNISNDGKVGTTSGLPLITTTGGAVTTGSFGTSAGSFCEGNDSRLSDARTPTSHTHGNISNTGTLGTASVVVITDGNKKISASTVTTTELGYLSGVTSSLQTQIDGKAASSHVHGNITNDGKVGTTSGKPLITGTEGLVQAGSFGTTAGSFCEGNDSRLSDARTPTSHTHGNITNDGKVGTTSGKPLITTTGGAVTAGSFGSTAGTFCEGNDSRLSDARTPVSHTHGNSDIISIDASKITSGTIDIARLPAGALERLVPVANQAARFALTTADVQLGDTVKQEDTGVMYYVKDTDHLDSETGYEEYTAGAATSVPWSGVTGKPSTYTPSSHTHGNITNDGSLGTASVVVVTDGSKKITGSTVTTTELGYLSGVTSAVQTQLNGKATSDHVHGNITNDGKVGTTSGKPLITTTGGAVTAGSFGSTAGSFCEGNDSRLSDARTPTSHTHGNISNDGKVGTTAGLPLITGTEGLVQAGAFGNSAGTFCQGNDSRLSNARTPTSHTHGNITNTGALGSASVVVVTDADKKITASTVTDTELGYLSGVSSNIQTQLNGKAASSHGTHVTYQTTGTPANIGTAALGSSADVARADHVHALPNSGVTAGSYGLSGNISPGYAGTFDVPYITVDAQGRVTAASTKTVTLPSGADYTLVEYTQTKTTAAVTYGPFASTAKVDYKQYTEVYVGGVKQPLSAYNYSNSSGTTVSSGTATYITFTENVPANVPVIILYPH